MTTTHTSQNLIYAKSKEAYSTIIKLLPFQRIRGNKCTSMPKPSYIFKPQRQVSSNGTFKSLSCALKGDLLNMQAAQKRLKEILVKCQAKGIEFENLKAYQQLAAENASSKLKRILKYFLLALLTLFIVDLYFNELQTQRCLLEMPRQLSYAFRPPEKCDFCRDVHKVERLSGISSEEFTAKYAYKAKPVVVEDATKNWTALSKFDYWYFKKVYRNAKRKQKILDCQFLPYKTGFKNIFEALDMPTERVELKPGTQPWYFGWSNCNPETAEEFRRHYGRPYFLPKTSENNAVDWFFIGTSGLGAHMHIDNVRLPSWQAQLLGSKRWILAPPPECYFECQQFDVVVNRGDIIVLDTNKWYHQTFVQPGQISLTIGAEYD